MKKVTYILLLLVLLCTAAASAKRKVPASISERKQQERVYFFHEGKKRATFGDAKGAAYCFRRALKADPGCDACYYELASLAVDAKQAAEALELLQAAYRLDTANLWYALRLAQLLVLNNKLPEAEAYYERALALNPKLQEAYAELMFIYDKEEKYDEGVQMVARYQQSFGVDEPSIISKQGFLYKAGRIDEAIAEAKTLVEMHPSEQQYRLMLAELYGAQRYDSLAFDALQGARALDSASLEYMIALSDHYRRLSDFENYFTALFSLFASKLTPATTKLQVLDFLLQFPAVEQQFSASIDSLYSLARTKFSYQTELLYSKHLIQTQRFSNASTALKLITARGAYDAYLLDVIKNKKESKFFAAYKLEVLAYYEAWDLFFDMLMSRQAWSHLFAEADSYAAIFPDKYRADFLKGLARFHEKKYDEAIALWRQAEASVPQADTAFRARLYFYMGDLYSLQKKYALLDKYLEKSLKLEPNNIMALNNYAYYLSLRKTKLKKALAMSKITIDAEPDNATYLDTYAWILYEMKRYEESKKVFQRALVHGGNEEGVMLEHYGDVLYALRELSNAHIYWQRALESGNDTPELREKLKRKE